MTATELTLDIAMDIVRDLRPEDRAEILTDDLHGWCAEMLMRDDGDQYAWFDHGTPVAMGGVQKVGDTAFPWFLATYGVGAIGVEIHHWALRLHRTWMSRVREFLVASWCSHPTSHLWLRRLGYSELQRFDHKGMDFQLYSKEGALCVTQ